MSFRPRGGPLAAPLRRARGSRAHVGTVDAVSEPGVGRAAREPLRCPNDGSRLVEVERSEILIDACPSCRGVWLDRGELDKILVRERELRSDDPDEDFFREVEGRRRRSREPEPYEEYGERRPRRRGLLEDLLDFD